MSLPPNGFGSPDAYTEKNPPTHRDRCDWCGECLECCGGQECPSGTDGLHYWPPRHGGAS